MRCEERNWGEKWQNGGYRYALSDNSTVSRVLFSRQKRKHSGVFQKNPLCVDGCIKFFTLLKAIPLRRFFWKSTLAFLPCLDRASANLLTAFLRVDSFFSVILTKPFTGFTRFTFPLRMPIVNPVTAIAVPKLQAVEAIC